MARHHWSWKRVRDLGINFFIPLLVFFFFARCLRYELRSFQGNHSGFIRFKEFLASAVNPIFWDKSKGLLFENSDFEKGTLENWFATGAAFLSQPTKGDNVVGRGEEFPANHQGKFWIGTYEKHQGLPGERKGAFQGDSVSGWLCSVPFTIKGKFIGFLIGGGRSDLTRQDPGRQSVGLEVEGEIVREASGRNRDIMQLRIWNVARWQGRSARIIIKDNPSQDSVFRHINADWFHYYWPDRMARIRKTLIVRPRGYDGQFFYYITYDPLLLRFKDAPGKYRLLADQPMYRYGRIAYPLLIKLASLDRPAYYPRVMMGLIAISHFFGALFFLLIIRFFRRSPWWALLYILVPGYCLSLSTALPESIAMAFLLGGLYFYLKGRTFSPVLLFTVAVLTRETTGLALLAIVLSEFLRGRNRKRALALTLPFFSYISWRLYLTVRLFEYAGWETLTHRPPNLTLPFSGFVELYQKILSGAYHQALSLEAAVYPILLAILFVFSVYFFGKKRGVFCLSLLMFSLVSVSLNFKQIWVHMDNGTRSTFEPFFFLVIAYVSERSSLKRIPPWLILAFFGLVFIFDFVLLTRRDVFRAGFFLQ